MTTLCSYCNRDITRNEQDNERFVSCSCGRFTPKNVTRLNIKLTKEDKMVEESKDRKKKAPAKEKVAKEKKEAKPSMRLEIEKMIDAGKTNQEIVDKTGAKINYVRTARYNYAHPKK